MKITSVTTYTVPPRWLFLRVETDDGLVGWGEMAPLGSFYDPSFAAAAREGARLLAPHLIGLDPREHEVVNATFDLHLNGHPYAKSALDMACWDISAQASGLPLAEARRCGDWAERCLLRVLARAMLRALCGLLDSQPRRLRRAEKTLW